MTAFEWAADDDPRNSGISGLQADAGGVGSDVGPTLIDHPDDADGHADLLHAQAIGERRAAHDLAHRVGEDTLSKRGNSVGIEGGPSMTCWACRQRHGERVSRWLQGSNRLGPDQGVGRRVKGGVLD